MASSYDINIGNETDLDYNLAGFGGVLIDASDNPLSNHILTLYSFEDRTFVATADADTQGNFSFLNLLPRIYILTVADYEISFIQEFNYKDELLVDIQADQNIFLEIRARQKITSSDLLIEGIVLDSETDEPIPDARIDLYSTRLRIRQNLRCFKEPDTTSEIAGQLSQDDYSALEIRLSYPNENTDFIKVQSNSLGDGSGWICSRDRSTHYALLYDKKEQEEAAVTTSEGKFSIPVSAEKLYKLRVVLQNYFDAESPRTLPGENELTIKMISAPNNINESYLIDRLRDFKGFSYKADRQHGIPRYPYQLSNVNLPLAPPKENDCCSFVEGLLVKAWEDAQEGFQWSLDKHKQVMIYDPDSDRFSPITTIVSAGMGAELGEKELPANWTIVQGWRTNRWSDGGHTFLIVDIHPESQRVLTLECNYNFGLNGPGFRVIGDLDQFEDQDFSPGNTWWNRDDLPTWDQIRQVFPYMKKAKLKVFDLKWIQEK